MKRHEILTTTIAASFLLSTAAWAEVTAEQVWQNWQDIGATTGQFLAADSQSRSGDTLTVNGMRVSTAFEGGSVEGRIDSVAFRERGDGAVEITMSPEYLLRMEMDPAEAEAVTLDLALRQSGLIIVASGSDTETSYDYDAAQITLTLTGLKVDGQDIDADALITVAGLAGNYVAKGAETKHLSSTVSAESLAFAAAVASPETSGMFNATGMMEKLAGASTTSLLTVLEMAKLSDALAAGFAAEAALTYGKSSYNMSFSEGGMTSQSSARADSGFVNFALDRTRLNYGVGSTNADFTFSGSDLPFPEINLKYAEAAFNLLMPITKSDLPGDFAFLTRIAGLEISDGIWGMFDPAGILPRDLATLVIDLKGKANWLIDITDTEVATADQQTPGELHALDVDEVRVAIVGADLSGNGSFTFDNNDLTSFDGIPAPTGKIDMKLVGANGLIDNLVKMGLLADEEAMTARMMMGLFTRPGNGEDTLTSTLEVKDAAIFANGQRLQ